MSIYVLRSDNLVKVGFTDDLRQRVQSIIAAVPVPVEFVGHMPGGRDVEAHLHERFAAHRFSGEWFVETDQMRAVFETILTPRLPAAPETEKEKKRRGAVSELKATSARLRGTAEHLWPLLSQADRLSAVAEELEWTRSRVKDVFYADPRVAIRAHEQAELDAWFSKIEVEA